MPSDAGGAVRGAVEDELGAVLEHGDGDRGVLEARYRECLDETGQVDVQARFGVSPRGRCVLGACGDLNGYGVRRPCRRLAGDPFEPNRLRADRSGHDCRDRDAAGLVDGHVDSGGASANVSLPAWECG